MGVERPRSPVVDELEPERGATLDVAGCLGPHAFVLVPPPREDGFALRITLEQPRHVGLDDRQTADEAGLAQGGAQRYRRREADEVDRPRVQRAHDGDQIGRVRIGGIVPLRRPRTGSVKPMAVGDEPVAAGEDLPLGLPVPQIRAAAVREHHGDTVALVHVLEIDAVHMNVHCESGLPLVDDLAVLRGCVAGE